MYQTTVCRTKLEKHSLVTVRGTRVSIQNKTVTNYGMLSLNFTNLSENITFLIFINNYFIS